MIWQWRKSDSIQFILVSYKETVNTLFNQKWDLERICEKRKCNHRRLYFVNMWTRPVMHGGVSNFTKSIETINGWNEKNWDKNTLTIVLERRRGEIYRENPDWGHSRGCCIDGQGSWIDPFLAFWCNLRNIWTIVLS